MSLNDSRKKGGCFGAVGDGFFTFVGLVACFFPEIEWVKEEVSEILENFQENTAGVAELSFLTPDSLEFSCLSNLLETGSGRCLDAGKEMLCFELDSSVELGWFSLGCCLLEELVWVRVVTPLSVQVKIDLLLIKLFNTSDYSRKLLVFLTR